LIFYRIRYVSGKNISKYQSGGRARCGAVQQLIRIVEDIQVYINQDKPTRKGRGFKNYVILVLLDASKAFEGITGRLFDVPLRLFFLNAIFESSLILKLLLNSCRLIGKLNSTNAIMTE